jgi:hypothetical protein
MMNFLPLLIILVIVVGMFSLVAKIMNNKTLNRKGKYSYSNRVRRIFAGYLAILLICVVLDSVLPAKGMLEWKVVRTGDLEKENANLYDAALKGRIDKVDPKLKVKNWNFDFHDQKLTAVVQNNEVLYNQVVIERKKTNDDKIEAVYYKTRSSMNNMDITQLVNPIALKLAGDQLTLIPPQRSKTKFSEFANVFSINQFTGEKTFSHSSNFVEGQSILYLRIPKDLQLVANDNLNIEFVQ